RAVGLTAAGQDAAQAGPAAELGHEHVGGVVGVARHQVGGVGGEGDEAAVAAHGRPAAVPGCGGAVGRDVDLDRLVGHQVPDEDVGADVGVAAGRRHGLLAAGDEGDVVAVSADPR